MTDKTLDRLASVAHFVIAEDKAGDIGKTKLNKILWFADCAAWRRLGRTITGLTEYAKLQYGPVPPRIDFALNRLVADGSVRTDSHYVGTYVRHAFVSLKSPHIGNLLTPEDKEILSSVMEAVRPLTAFEVSELSHDALWEETPHGAMIPVQAASAQLVAPDERILEWARKVG